MMPDVTGEEIQLENGGFTRIHNAILETLARANLSPLEFRIVSLVLRKTYGFGKKEDVISLSQFEDICGASRRATITAIQNLMRLKVLERKLHGAQSFSYGFNKYIETWLPETFVSRHVGRSRNFHKQPTSEAVGLVKPLGTSEVGDTRTSEVGDTRTSEAIDTHKRKKEKKESVVAPKPLTAQQEFFGAVCTCIGWDSQTITKTQRGQVASTVEVLQKAKYTIDDLRAFWVIWRDDWRYKKNKSLPTLEQLRAEIGKVRLLAQPEAKPYAAEVYG